MTTQKIGAAMRRVEAVLQRRPGVGIHDDAPAAARWEGGTRVVSSHGNGTRLITDMPEELGGSGDQVTPGWLFRAGLASCAATRIAMGAAAEGIELGTLEVLASSKSDTRGLLGMDDGAGQPVGAGPCAVQLLVRISAHGIEPARLRALVDASYRCSPIPSAVVNAVPVALQVEVGAA
ncbi:MAG: OsmC family protein [Casimicrobiaceae bacterium]